MTYLPQVAQCAEEYTRGPWTFETTKFNMDYQWDLDLYRCVAVSHLFYFIWILSIAAISSCICILTVVLTFILLLYFHSFLPSTSIVDGYDNGLNFTFLLISSRDSRILKLDLSYVLAECRFS